MQMQADDPVIAELRRRGVSPSTDNYNRLSAAMKGAGWSGGHAPVNVSPMTLSGQVPDDMQYGAQQNDPDSKQTALDEVEAEEIPDQYGKELSEADAYLDNIAGDGKTTARSKQAATPSQNVVGGGKQQMGSGGKTEQPELNNGESNMGGAQPNMEEGSSWIADALTALLGGGALAAGAKMLGMGGGQQPAARGNPQMTGALEGEVLPPEDKMKALPAPEADRRLMIEQQLKQALPKPDVIYQGAPEEQKALPKPRHRVKAGSSKAQEPSKSEQVGEPDKEFQQKSQAGYDKAKSEGRVGRPKSKAKSEASNDNEAKTKSAARKKALGALAKRTARK